MKGGGSNGQCVPGTWELSSNLNGRGGGTSSGPGDRFAQRLLPSESLEKQEAEDRKGEDE